MKARIQYLFLLAALMAGLELIPARRAAAQAFTILYNFTSDSSGGNIDGGSPNADLILSGDTLYGTAEFGGNSDLGTVFALNTNGSGFAEAWRFIGSSEVTSTSEGVGPVAGVTLLGDTLYGTTPFGGSANEGAVFSVKTNGGPYTAVHNFTSLSSTGGTYGTNSDGGYPYAGLILSGNTLYGTVFFGGASGWGTVFAVNTDSSGFTNLHSFTGGGEGANPYGGLILSGSTLYGTTSSGFIPGEQSGFGTVFALNTNGSGFTTLYSFTNGIDGSQPFGGLILSGDILYGTAYAGGSSGWGTVFALHTNGSDFTSLYTFTNGNDGSQPWAELMLSGSILYGTATRGGSANSGTVFSVTTNGSNFTTLHGFTASVYDGISAYTNSDGNSPMCGLILSGNTLYGTAEGGGSGGSGTIFSISLASVGALQLGILAAGTSVVLTWPTNEAGFTLQSTTNLVSPVAWSAVSPAPFVVNGQNTVTNPISGIPMFFRLSQ
jgi:uncharacterized repeat protein (TIGR03803 family)